MKKKQLPTVLIYFLIIIIFSGCSLLGIHLQVKNPKHAGKYPRFSASTKLLGAPNKYRSCFNATYYNLNVSVKDKNKSLMGTVIMNAKTLSDFDTLQIDLYPNMQLNKISLEGNALSYSRKYGAVYVRMPRTMKHGENFSLNIEYEGKPLVAKKPPWKGGFVWKKDKEKNPWIGVACETEGASLWWPCKDVTNDEPDSAAINITVDTSLVAVANGHLLGKEVNNNSSTYHWHVSYPINMYDISIYVGKFELLADSVIMPSGKTLHINDYVLPMDYAKAKVHLAQAKEQLAFYEKTFGDYPWYKDGYKLIESPYEGMEHQTAIAYGNGFKKSFYGFDYIILHESAHEWWGNNVSAADFADVWLQEGFATYSEALYVESIQGKEAYLRYLLTYRLFIKNKRPVVGPTGVRFFDYKDSDVYMKGAWTLHTLRTLINNDSLFFNILQSFQKTYSLKTVTSKDFIIMVNQKTGKDYNWFFKQYLYKREVPFLEYYWDGTNFYYKWKYVDSTFTMPAEIALDGLVRISLKPTSRLQKMAIDGNAYKEISFNNYTELFGIEENKRILSK